MNAAIIIPARYGSTRLPGKPLLAETGKPLIQHVYEQAKKSKRASAVIVATDDARIFEAVKSFGGDALMTAADHESGSARVAEAASAINADIIVNLQGDEPEVDPAHIDRLIEIQAAERTFASTLACRFPSDAKSGAASPDDPSAVKVILGPASAANVHRALYFTRSLCPYPRDNDGLIQEPEKYYLHIGVYGFTRASLKTFASAPPGALEQTERLEQLRILEMGEPIAVGIIGSAPPGIDTPADYAAFVRRSAGQA